MRKLILPMVMMALMAIPATADAAAQCRNAKGQFAKCGSPGALPPGAKAAPSAKATPAMAAPAMKPAMGPAMKAGPAMAPAKKGPCKDSKGKFVKC